MKLEEYVKNLYGTQDFFPCLFTEQEITELGKTDELLVYLPANISMAELCDRFKIKTNINFENETLIRNVMTNENQWFIADGSEFPELINKSGRYAKRIYENQGLFGMDFRRYLAFVGTFQNKFGKFPDQQYWTYLLSGSYDRSGTSIIGFDKNKILSHHGWIDDFKKQFVGSRYVVIPPRIEINSETEKLKRAYRTK